MKRIFLFLFFFFWVVPLPLLVYYGGDGFTNNNGCSQTMAYVWLGISVVFWLWFLQKFFKWLILGRYGQISAMENLMQNGALINSIIKQSILQTPEFPGVDKYDLVVEFKNFVGTTVHEKFSINDSHPELHKYVEGKSLKLRVDKELTNIPYLQVDGAHYDKPTPKAMATGIIIYLVVILAIAAYFYYAYVHEFGQPSWRFLCWNHPLVICPVLLCILMFFSGPTNKLTSDQLQHKYYGYRTEAEILNVAETGTYINDQPSVRFNIRYADQTGKKIDATFTKTIGILEVGLTQQKTIEIFYLQNKPGDIRVASELEKV